MNPKKPVFATIILILISSLGNQSIYSENMEKENIPETIIAIEKAALEKWNQGDPSGYLAIYAPEITYFDPLLYKRIDGFDELKKLYDQINGQVAVDTFEMIDPKVQVSGNMAVLTFNLNSHVQNTVYKWNCTEVYRQESENVWKIIHNHWSFVRPMDMKE